jgi:hypothetical protein
MRVEDGTLLPDWLFVQSMFEVSLGSCSVAGGRLEKTVVRLPSVLIMARGGQVLL